MLKVLEEVRLSGAKVSADQEAAVDLLHRDSEHRSAELRWFADVRSVRLPSSHGPDIRGIIDIDERREGVDSGLITNLVPNAVSERRVVQFEASLRIDQSLWRGRD